MAVKFSPRKKNSDSYINIYIHSKGGAEKKTRYCGICGTELEDDEPDICRNCQSNILINRDIPP